MEWVETTGRTVDEAKDLALDQLGVDEAEAEFEVLDEPRPGLFGRMRGEARVRARVQPTRPRPKVERRDRKRRSSADSPAAEPVAATVAAGEATTEPAEPAPRRNRGRSRGAATPDNDRAPSLDSVPTSEQQEAITMDSSSPDAVTSDAAPTEPISPEAVGAEAVRFVEGLLDAFDLEGEVALRQDGDDLEVTVTGDDLGVLIGPRGATLLAVQDLTRVVSQRRLGDHETRLRLDIGGYRERRREALSRFAEGMAAEVVASGVARVLEPMPSADRKVVHDVLSGRDDVVTRSEGEDPFRRVVIAPVEG